MTINVRPAVPADVPAMSRVLTASITQLCGADHGNDPARVARWTANKTHEGVAVMLANPELTLLVAERDGVVAGVGALSGAVIALNYVAPEHRFTGVSRALLAALEARMQAADVAEGRLVSTWTARRFYADAGWLADGEPQDHGGMLCYPMRKALDGRA